MPLSSLLLRHEQLVLMLPGFPAIEVIEVIEVIDGDRKGLAIRFFKNMGRNGDTDYLIV